MSARERQKIDKAVRELDRKKLLHMLHHEFREFDRAKKDLATRRLQHRQSQPSGNVGGNNSLSGSLDSIGSSGKLQSMPIGPDYAATPTGIIDQSMTMASAASGTSSLGRDALSSPPTDLYSVKSIVNEIAWQKRSQKMSSMVRSRSSFGSVLQKARVEISRLPFSPMRHSASFTSSAGSCPVSYPPLSPQDLSKHFVGEFGDQWFENDKPAMKRMLSTKTRSRTRFERDEFLEACKTAARLSGKAKRLGPISSSSPGSPPTAAAGGARDDDSSNFEDPNTDGRLAAYDMLRSNNGTVLKRKFWKNLRSNTRSGPVLDACPLLTILAGRPTSRWSSATGHDKPLPKSKVICNAEAGGAINNMKNMLPHLEKAYYSMPRDGLTIAERNVHQELHRSIHFYKSEISRLHADVPSVKRKRLAAVEARRMAAVQARKDAARARKMEAKRMQEEKAAKAARAAALFAAANRPATAHDEEETEEERQARIEDDAARMLQRIGQGYLGRKRFKEAEAARPKQKKKKKK